MASKCVKMMGYSLPLSPLFFFAIFFLDWIGSYWCELFRVSISNIHGDSTNLLNCYIISVALSSVWGQVMCELLVDI